MRFMLLGSGAVRTTLDRWGPAQILQIGDEYLLFDCGRNATTRIVQAGVNLPDVSPVFFTHHHYDHNCDFTCFFLTGWVMGRDVPLKVYGPSGTEALCRGLFKEIYAEDIATRARHPMYSKLGCEFDACDVTEETWTLEAGDWRIHMVHGDHCKPAMDSLAFRVEAEGKSIVVVGDTTLCEPIMDLAEGCDLLVHECTFPTERMESGHWVDFHTSPRQLGRWARERGVKRLLLKHFAVQEGVTVEGMAAEVRAEFGDKGLIVGEDLLSVEI